MIAVLPALIAATPVVDIDGTLWVQGGLFLGMVLLLRPLLFRPWLEAQARRGRAIDGALVDASRLRREADELHATHTTRFAEARETAVSLRSRVRREEEAGQASTLQRVREEANAELERERSRLTREAELARKQLGERVDELAGRIAEKILGRAP